MRTLSSDSTIQASATIYFIPDLVAKDYVVHFPRVVDALRPAPMRFLVVPPAGTFAVTYRPSTGGAVTLAAIGNGVLTFEVGSARMLAGYEVGTLHSAIGRLDYRDAAGVPIKLTNLSVNVRDGGMPDVAITAVTANAQRSGHLLNLRLDSATSSPSAAVVARALQLLGGDQFDFVAVIATVNTTTNRYYVGLRNDVAGIGAPVFDNSGPWGGAGKLRGVINFPIDEYFDGAEHGFIHEIGHCWINYATDPVLAAGGVHWPLSTMALGVMGFSIPGSGAGGQFPWALTPIGAGGMVRIDAATPTDHFTPLDLYVMGLLSADVVPPMYVLPSTVDANAIVPGMVSPATTYTIADYLAGQGVRVPASTTAPRAFTGAVVVLSYGRLLTPSEMAFFDAAVARAETRVALRAVSGLATVDASGFFLATGGRATLRTSLP